MNIVSWNVNGLRAVAKKGFLEYLQQYSPDILCLQETKANEEDLDASLIHPGEYSTVFHSAQKKGYSGVAIYTKPKPKMVLEGFGNDKFDAEGRVIVAEYDGFFLLNVYFPNGKRDEERLQYKLDFYEALFNYCEDLKSEGKPLIVVGDYNTAHQEIDLARPNDNTQVSGFLAIERAWIDKIINEYGFVDSFRKFNQNPQEYSWWSYRAGARPRNVGWRIDYVMVSENLLPQLKNAYIHQQVMGSDHCPVGIEL